MKTRANPANMIEYRATRPFPFPKRELRVKRLKRDIIKLIIRLLFESKMSRDRTRQAGASSLSQSGASRRVQRTLQIRAECVIVFAESHCLAPVFTFFSLFVSPRMARADRKRGEIIGYRSEMAYSRSAPLCVCALRTTMERPR